ncbi:MAG: hypothetical protein K2X73_05510 [Sphingomonas sp.]|uniref:hypothetical protein n=1 Tax=Sphingomonas sp. TaxID=28214 RepID=UPI0025D8208E|nr:hypothetical protein [Sphingomonas sp.]MBX9881413.1 hypothetical protein [Sphingomonas sp.]
MLLLLLAQAATPVTTMKAAPPPERFSILAPVPGEPCRPGPAEGEVVVCGNALPSQKLPYPEEIDASRPRPSNPDLTGHGALAAMNTPCAATSGGCGGGLPIIPLALALGKALVKAATPKPDKSKRVPIPLDEPAPARAE